jgi:Tfp pilus assembly protein PilN
MTAMYQQINLYQPIFRKQRQIFSAMTMVRAAGVVAVALVGFYFLGLWQVEALETEVVRLESSEAAMLTRLASIDPSLSLNRRVEVEEELRRLNATLRDQARLIDGLNAHPLGTTEGFSAFLAALGRQHTAELWLTELAINGSTRALELEGRSTRAELVMEYLERLGHEPALAGQRFDRLEIARVDDGAEVTFEVKSKAADSPEARETLASDAQ